MHWEGIQNLSIRYKTLNYQLVLLFPGKRLSVVLEIVGFALLLFVGVFFKEFQTLHVLLKNEMGCER